MPHILWGRQTSGKRAQGATRRITQDGRPKRAFQSHEQLQLIEEREDVPALPEVRKGEIGNVPARPPL